MNHAELSTIARAMRAELPIVGRSERVLNGRGRAKVYLRLHARHDRLSLAVGHRDAFPDPDEAGQIALLFGASGDPVREHMLIASQDGHWLRVPCLTYAWFENRN